MSQIQKQNPIMKLILTIESARGWGQGRSTRQSGKAARGIYVEIADILDVAAAKIRDGQDAGYCIDSQGERILVDVKVP